MNAFRRAQPHLGYERYNLVCPENRRKGLWEARPARSTWRTKCPQVWRRRQLEHIRKAPESP